MPFVVDVQCVCGHVRTIWFKNSEAGPDADDAACPKCGSEKFERLVGQAAYHKSNDPEVRSAMLKKRSDDHSRATFKDNLERVKAYGKKRGVDL